MSEQKNEHPEQAEGAQVERSGLLAAAKWHRERQAAFEADAEAHRQSFESANRPDSTCAVAEHHRRKWETAQVMAANHFDYAAEFERQARATLAQPSPAVVPEGLPDLCRFLAKLYCELDGLRYSTAKLPPEEIADALICKWPVLQGTRNQLNIKRISEQSYDESKLHAAIAAMLAAAPQSVAAVPQAWLDVQAERLRQIEAEGWTLEHDDQHQPGELAQAAAAYLLYAFPRGAFDRTYAARLWPWISGFKPTEERRDLERGPCPRPGRT